MIYDRFSGDPLLSLSSAGSEITFLGGQPQMDQGLVNQALIQLFTRKGWSGNIYLPLPRRIGSDFVDICSDRITLKKVNTDIPDAARRALKSDYLPEITPVVTNPKSDRLLAAITLGPGGNLSLTRVGMKWAATASQALSEVSR